LLISYIAVIGAKSLNSYFSLNTQELFNDSKVIIKNTANTAITDSIKALDKKSQESLEVITKNIASNVAEFLYQRDNDILFLSKLPMNQNTLKSFYENKSKEILVHDKYYYNDQTVIGKHRILKKPSKEMKKMQLLQTIKENLIMLTTLI